MKNFLHSLPRMAKAIVGGAAGALIGSPVGQQVISDNPVVWSWEYFLASTFGIGVAVYVIPNKGKVDNNVIR